MTQGRPPRWRTTTRLLVWAAILSASAVTSALVEVMDASRRGSDLGLWEPMIWEFSSLALILLTLPLLWWGCERWPLHGDTGSSVCRSTCWPAWAGRYCTWWG